MVRPDADRIGGIVGEHVEVDETWVGGRTKGEGRGVLRIPIQSGRCFRFQAGRVSDLMPATIPK
jgi:hypothetical protein